MIKIVFSGTYDGFYPRYASDGVLDDDVTRQLLDRNMFFSKEENHLFREGYSFQVLKRKGIFFHKIILLSDAAWRDGFMMVSLFLPENKILDGLDIKNSLDSILQEYKTHIRGGIANIEIDWSFIKRKADELNDRKVRDFKWKNWSSSDPSHTTALIKGAESRVADYFQYPNPLHSGCDDFEQVFLTESILDPTKASNVDEIGCYKVLTTDDVDIDNPEYTIEYKNRLEGSALLGERSRITKKDLIYNIPLGIYSKPGYRSKEVTIPAGTKSLDGFTIFVYLPDLAPKSAKVEFEIFDNNTGLPISPSDVTISWSNLNSVASEPKSNNLSFHFEKEQCDSEWHYVVRCGAYEKYEEDITVGDGKNLKKNIQLMPKPLWNIYIQYPNGEKRSFCSNINDDFLKNRINLAKIHLKENGLDVEEPIQQDYYTHVIVVKGKKNTTCEVDVPTPSRQEPSTAAHTTIGKAEDTDEESKKTWYLYLAPSSKKYSLFKNYTRKCRLEEELSKYIQELDKLRKKVDKNSNLKLEKIIEALKENDAYQTESLWLKLYYENKKYFNNDKLGKQIATATKNALKSLQSWKKIPYVVKGPKDVRYNPRYHRLECERSECPGQNLKIVLGEDKYNYIIKKDSIYWTDTDDTYSSKKSLVERPLREKYKIIYGGVSIVALLILVVAIILIYSFSGNGKKLEEHKLKTTNWLTQVTREYPQSYCTDSIFSIGDTLNDVWQKLAKNDKELKNDIIYVTFDTVFNKQKDFKEEDNRVFEEALTLINDENLEEYRGLDKTVLTKAHKDTLDIKAKEKEKEIEDLEKLKEENKLYEKCMGKNGNVSLCDQFLKKYPGSIYEDEIRQRRQDLLDSWEQTLYKRCFQQDATVSTCDKYLNDPYIKELKDNLPQRFEDVKKRKDELSQKAQFVKLEPQPTQKSRLEQDGIKNIADLFEALADVETVMKGSQAFQNKYKFTNTNNAAKLREDTNEILNYATGQMGYLKGKKIQTQKTKYSECYINARKMGTFTEKLNNLVTSLKNLK